MERININGRTYEMDTETAGLLKMMMGSAVSARCEKKARAAMEFAVLAEQFGRATRIA